MYIDQYPLLYKDNLLEKLGGSNQFDFLVLTYCEAVQDDPKLKRFFGNYTLRELMEAQRVLLDAAFLQITPERTEDYVRNSVVLKNYNLFERGMNEKHFDRLLKHFTGALRDCWVQDDVLDLCTKYFTEVRSIFEDHGRRVEDLEIEKRAVSVRILNSSYRSSSDRSLGKNQNSISNDNNNMRLVRSERKILSPRGRAVKQTLLSKFRNKH